MRNVACKLCALHTPHIRAQGGHSGQLASLCFLRMWHPRTFRAQHACNTQHREKKRCLTSAGKMQRTQAWSPALQSTAANGVVQQRSLNKRPSTSFLWHGTPGIQQAVHLKGGGGVGPRVDRLLQGRRSTAGQSRSERAALIAHGPAEPTQPRSLEKMRGRRRNERASSRQRAR